jgi:murein DD-endopeptidase MepM/ murein hydrolase activator NlpD
VLAGIFLLAVLTRVLFPHFSKALGDRITEVVDYRAAMAALGEGVSGERKFTEALGEAWSLAFHPASGATDVDVSGEMRDGAAEGAMVSLEPFPSIPPLESTPPDSSAREDSTSVESSFAADSSAAVAAFFEAQRDYAEYSVPAGVTYAMPTLGISFQTPAEGVISSHFGYRRSPNGGEVRFHYGVDVAAERGAAVYAFADGTAAVVGESTTYGKYVVLRHADGVKTTYAHCDAILVGDGDEIAAGAKLAEMGSTGNATDVCLHFELKVDGVCVNPEYYIAWL